ncbi:MULTISPECIES: RHS repeat domain-containing protein, partial [Bacteroidaceae]
GGRLEQDGEWHCEYDGDGNLTERYLGTGKWLDGKKDRWRYRWNADGSLAKVVRPDKREVEFTYDALGRRLSKSFGTTVTRWMWNGNVPLHQWKQRREYSVMEDRWNTDTERRDMTVWLFDEESFVPMAMIKEGRSYSILTDQLGTPTEAYDAEGNEVWSRVLDMDGNVIEETGNKGMVPFLFQGQYYDCETGLAYNRFRYYSPKMGMYVSQDPIRLTGRILNLYGYVCNTTYLCDPFGLVYQSHNHGDVNDSVTILRRQNIRNYQIEVHVDSHGPHIHLDRGTRQERYINISGMSNEQALRELPNKLRRESSVSAAINNALNY